MAVSLASAGLLIARCWRRVRRGRSDDLEHGERLRSIDDASPCPSPSSPHATARSWNRAVAARSSTPSISRPTTPYSLCDLHDPFAPVDGAVKIVSLPPTPPQSPKRRARSTTSSSTLTSGSTYSTDSHRPPLPYRPGTVGSASTPLLIPIVTVTPPPSPVRQHVRQALHRHHTAPFEDMPRRPFASLPPSPKIHTTIAETPIVGRGRSALPRVRPRTDSRPPSIDLIRRQSTRSWLIDTSASLSSIGRPRPLGPSVPAIDEL